MFLLHLNTELCEDDVQKITSGSKSKTQITVLTTCFFIDIKVYFNYSF